MPRIFAIGDIHGCSKTFKRLLLEKIQIRKSDKIYCIGDYVDRGKDSKGVIDFIIKLRKQGYHIHTLRGNHEQMMLDAPISKIKMQHWLKNGGSDTMKSFRLKSLNEISPEYLSFLKRTKHYIKTKKFLFVHAGLNFKNDNPFLDKEAMLWTRDVYTDKSKINGKILIHGHTPIPNKPFLHQSNPFKINIDSGCVYSNIPGYGYLTALSLPDLKLIQVRNIDN